jgi:Tfp pilus assembly protein PilZ
MAPTTTAAASPVVLSLTSPVAPGSTAQLAVQTIPNAACSLAYTTPAGTASEARGLGVSAADAAGRVSWARVIGTATRAGTGTLRITCGSQVTTAPIVVS